jgi:adenosylcobinamide-GDP ribazoletransferase
MIAWARRFLLALQFLTVVTFVSRLEPRAGDRAGSMIFYPVIGLLLGLAVAGADYGLGLVFPPLVTAVLVVALWEFFVRGLHLDGLADVADAFMGTSDRARTLDILHDTRVGVFGAAAVFFVILLKVALVAHLGPHRFFGLLLVPVMPRLVMVLLAWAMPSAGGALGKPFVEELRWGHALAAAILAAVVLLLLGGWGGMITGLVGLAWTLIWGGYVWFRLRGVTGDCLGAAGELGEALVLATWLLAPGAPWWLA